MATEIISMRILFVVAISAFITPTRAQGRLSCVKVARACMSPSDDRARGATFLTFPIIVVETCSYYDQMENCLNALITGDNCRKDAVTRLEDLRAMYGDFCDNKERVTKHSDCLRGITVDVQNVCDPEILERPNCVDLVKYSECFRDKATTSCGEEAGDIVWNSVASFTRQISDRNYLGCKGLAQKSTCNKGRTITADHVITALAILLLLRIFLHGDGVFA